MITVIGSINLDLIATVGRLPDPGETVAGEAFSTAPGGKGANQALAARRAGAKVRMVGAVGRDAFAGEALALLKQAGVDLSDVRETHAATGTALILVGGDGENMIAVVPGANGAVVPGDVATADLRAGEYLLVQHEIPLATVEAALKTARANGATSILNIAPFDDRAAGFLAEADIVVANESEFDLAAKGLGLGDGDREDMMRIWAGRTGRVVVVTLGAKGVMAATPDGFHHVAAPAIEPVDTVGAGDTFCGYLAAGLSDGLPLAEALGRAAVAGAIACLKPGAQPSIPSAAEVTAWMS
ncbi:MAG: ribokinase [Rhizobiaceae bacterium]|nr:ribokinase [Rhizobiaceae bacterium]MCV0405010.1 ribokinase [Rhizobiaceae bacterium]